MALSILDGNQSATTLSTILSSGQHITAHTVVSLGTQAKTDILSAISSGIAISGTVTANAGGDFGNSIENVYDVGNVAKKIAVQLYDDNGIAVGVVNNPLPISGTVTANSSNGSLTTRFGSVTNANTAFATSAVTNANRKYLLIQNITTASNAITVGIGFTPTTTQGILLSSGAVITFDGNYIPTGAVNLLSSVTASCFTILEA
jgi:hypothetical protein